MRKTVFGCCASAWLSAKSTAQRVRMVNFFFMAFSMPRSTCPSTLDTRPFSFDHPVRPRQHIRWNRQADQLRCFQIDDELKLLRLLYGEIRGVWHLLKSYLRKSLRAGSSRSRLRRRSQARRLPHVLALRTWPGGGSLPRALQTLFDED